MRYAKRRYGVLPAGLILAIVLFAGLSEGQKNRPVQWPEKVNLALRRTAHHLLAQSGDSTSPIPPVLPGEKPDTWIIRLERPFGYDALPPLLQESFDLHGITEEYDVMLLDCENLDLLLGYNKRDFTDKNETPCGTREQNGRCYNVQVSFPGRTAGGRPLWAILFAVLPLGYLLYRRLKNNDSPVATETQAEDTANAGITRGQSTLNVANQHLWVAGARHDLTYREAKLLQLFFNYPNQLLERNFILQNVWADEGILVGRSVDMFVSRLRKLLRTDTSLRIATVHGVGYRLEVND